jgi:Tfp pilus assembly protein PilX
MFIVHPVVRPLARQHGSSLVVTMLMLVALMLIGGTAVVVSNSQYRMAGNLQFQNLAMNDAESAVAQAENWIGASNHYNDTGFSTRGSGGLYPKDSNPDPYNLAWDDATSENVVNSAGNQRYIIEKLGGNRPLPSNSLGNCNIYGAPASCPRVSVYRATGRGFSVRGTVKLVQSIFAVPITGAN